MYDVHLSMVCLSVGCVFTCNKNYKSTQVKTKCGDQINKISVYCFPKDKRKKERKKWRKNIPNANLNVTDNPVIWELYWPSKFYAKEIYRKIHTK